MGGRKTLVINSVIRSNRSEQHVVYATDVSAADIN